MLSCLPTKSGIYKEYKSLCNNFLNDLVLILNWYLYIQGHLLSKNKRMVLWV